VTHHRFGLLNRKCLIGLLVLSLALLGTSISCLSSNKGIVLVTRVIDGDTVEIEGGARVRYIGINTPEIGEPYYHEATEANRQLVLGKRVYLEEDVQDKDKYGRLLRYVWVDDTIVNAELVRQGYAYSYTYPPNVKHQKLFLQLEKEARDAVRGLWANQ
jgi:micrococcal nuclease